MRGAMPEIDLEKCSGCGDCMEWCPKDAVRMVNGKATVISTEGCSYCTDCEAVCSTGAIRCPFEIILSPPERVGVTKNNKRDSPPGGRAK